MEPKNRPGIQAGKNRFTLSQRPKRLGVALCIYIYIMWWILRETMISPIFVCGLFHIHQAKWGMIHDIHDSGEKPLERPQRHVTVTSLANLRLTMIGVSVPWLEIWSFRQESWGNFLRGFQLENVTLPPSKGNVG